MLSAIGVLLVIVGVILVALAVLVWLGIIAPRQLPSWKDATTRDWSDVAKAVLDKVPWVALVGVAFVYLGLRAAGADLSF